MRSLGLPQKPKPRHIYSRCGGLLAPDAQTLLRGVIRRFVLTAFLFATLSVGRGEERPLKVSSDFGEADRRTNEQVLRGHARVTDDVTLITADEIRIGGAQGEIITAKGNVTYTKEAARLLADQLTLDRSKQAFTATKVRFGSYPYYAEAESAQGSMDEIVFTKASVSYGEPGPWQPTARADKVIYAPGKRLRTENAQAGIGTAQPFPFPKFSQDLKQPLLSFASLNGGYRSLLGAFVEASVHIPAAEAFRIGGDVGIYSKRGVLFGPSGSYGLGSEDANYRGNFRTGYINDHGDKRYDLLGRPVPENRGYVEWQHEQKIGDFSLTAQLNYWKDSEVIRDFRPRAFYPVQEPDTFVEAVYQGDNYLVSAFARFQPNSFNTVQERLPEIHFDLLPTALGNGFYERFNASAAVLREDSPVGRPRMSTDRLDAYYAISRPITQGDWFSFTPVVGARVTHYTNSRSSVLVASPLAPGPASITSGLSVPPLYTPNLALPVGVLAPVDLPNYTRTLGEVGADLAIRTSGTFNYKNEQWKIDGLRHLMTPKVSWRYISQADKGWTRMPHIDRRTFATYLQPLGLGDVRNIDDLRETNILRFGLDNTLQTRDPVYGSRDLLTFNIANDFRFIRAPGERDVSEVHTELALAPTRWLSVDVYDSFSPQSFTLREFNAGVTLHDADAWSVRFSNNFLRDEIQDYQVDGRLRINETYEMLTRLHYDARKRRFNEQAYGVTQNLGNTWLISYIVSLYDGPRRESHFGLNIQIAARGF